MVLHVAFLVFGVFACSTAVIMIKACTVPPTLLAAYRLFVAAAILTPFYLRERQRLGEAARTQKLATSILPGIALGIHFISWIMGARMTPAANASLIVNLVPVAMPFFLIWLVREPLTRRELVATGVALVGLCILSAGDFHVSRTHFLGDVTCLGSMLFFTFYLALGRRNRHAEGIWIYLVPLYWVAAFFSLGVGLCMHNPLDVDYSIRNVLLTIGLGVIPTVVGHSILNFSMKRLRGQLVAIVNMGQFIFAGTMAFFLYAERPALAFYPACALLISAAWLVVSENTARKGDGIGEDGQVHLRGLRGGNGHACAPPSDKTRT